jgi:hypothetical protein
MDRVDRPDIAAHRRARHHCHHRDLLFPDQQWSGLNAACLLAFGTILVAYVILFIRGVEMEMPA